MPVNTLLTGPSVDSETITKRIVDAERGDEIDITRTEVTSVNGSAPGSQPSWASFTVRGQRFTGGREERPVDLTVDPIALRSNGIEEFEFEIDYTDSKSSRTSTYKVIVDEITTDSARRYSYVDMDGFRVLAEDIAAGTGFYQLLRYPPPTNGVEVDSDTDSNGHWRYHMNGGMEVDAEAGYLFLKQIVDAEGSSNERVRILRYDLNEGTTVQVTPQRGVRAWDIDRQNQNIYWTWPDHGDWNPPNGSGIYRRSYDGTGQIKVADLFAGSNFLTGTVLDMDIDPKSDAMVLVGYQFTFAASSMVRTSLSDPDNDIEQRVVDDPDTGTDYIIQAVDVDWENRYVFTVESAGVYLVQRRLGDLVREQQHILGDGGLYVYGIAANPEDEEILLARAGELISAPYSDIANTTVEKIGFPHFPVYNEAENANATPRWEPRERVEFRH